MERRRSSNPEKLHHYNLLPREIYLHGENFTFRGVQNLLPKDVVVNVIITMEDGSTVLEAFPQIDFCAPEEVEEDRGWLDEEDLHYDAEFVANYRRKLTIFEDGFKILKQIGERMTMGEEYFRNGEREKGAEVYFTIATDASVTLSGRLRAAISLHKMQFMDLAVQAFDLIEKQSIGAEKRRVADKLLDFQNGLSKKSAEIYFATAVDTSIDPFQRRISAASLVPFDLEQAMCAFLTVANDPLVARSEQRRAATAIARFALTATRINESASTLISVAADTSCGGENRRRAAESLLTLGPRFHNQAVQSLLQISADDSVASRHRRLAAARVAKLIESTVEGAACNLAFAADSSAEAADRIEAITAAISLGPEFILQAVMAFSAIAQDERADHAQRFLAATRIVDQCQNYPLSTTEEEDQLQAVCNSEAAAAFSVLCRSAAVPVRTQISVARMWGCLKGSRTGEVVEHMSAILSDVSAQASDRVEAAEVILSLEHQSADFVLSSFSTMARETPVGRDCVSYGDPHTAGRLPLESVFRLQSQCPHMSAFVASFLLSIAMSGEYSSPAKYFIGRRMEGMPEAEALRADILMSVCVGLDPWAANVVDRRLKAADALEGCVGWFGEGGGGRAVSVGSGGEDTCPLIQSDNGSTLSMRVVALTAILLNQLDDGFVQAKQLLIAAAWPTERDRNKCDAEAGDSIFKVIIEVKDICVNWSLCDRDKKIKRIHELFLRFWNFVNDVKPDFVDLAVTLHKQKIQSERTGARMKRRLEVLCEIVSGRLVLK